MSKRNQTTKTKKLAYGDYCRARCTAPARYAGFGMCAFISAQDNSVTVDRVDPEGEPNPSLPHVSDRDLRIVFSALYAVDRR